eukprot:Sspe_Gene.17940::Locus_6413_Transcript_1_1_Confidence_1.000_Length_851::g.17940::m.17940/K21806/VCPKMT, METTL21D; protein N-lysine methyltransferase METTL21D
MGDLGWVDIELAAGDAVHVTLKAIGVPSEEQPKRRGARREEEERRVEQALEGCEDLLGSVMWNSINVFMKWLTQDSGAAWFRKKTVLELGAGTGAAGLVVGHMAKYTVITDLKEYIPLIDFNIVENGLEGKVKAAPLNWGRDTIPDSPFPPYDVVLMCDVLYGNRAAWDGLCQVLRELAESRPRFILCHEHRSPRDLPDFLEKLGWEADELATGISDSNSRITVVSLCPP